MKELCFVLGLFIPLLGFTQVTTSAASKHGSEVSVKRTTIHSDSLNIINLQRDPELDALVDYFQKEDPPIITMHAGEHFRRLPDLRPTYSYYRINRQKVTRGGVEEYLGEVDPLAYEGVIRGKELRRRGGRWFLVGLGGYLLVLSSKNRTVRGIGLGTMAVGATISLRSIFAGRAQQRRGIEYYNYAPR